MKILLFDVDGTLAKSGCKITEEMAQILSDKNKEYDLGVVGGGSYEKILWQLGDVANLFKFIFAESGAVTYIDGNLVKIKNMKDYINNFEKLVRFIKHVTIKFMKENNIPIYGYDVIDVRYGLIYISLAGIGADTEEREKFIDIDFKNNYRYRLLNILKYRLPDVLDVKLGGVTGMSVHIKGWDKSQVLYYLKDYEDIIFYGDRTEPEGNDFPLYANILVNGNTVTDDKDTLQKLKNLI